MSEMMVGSESASPASVLPMIDPSIPERLAVLGGVGRIEDETHSQTNRLSSGEWGPDLVSGEA